MESPTKPFWSTNLRQLQNDKTGYGKSQIYFKAKLEFWYWLKNVFVKFGDFGIFLSKTCCNTWYICKFVLKLLILDPEGVDITSGWQNVSDSLRKGYHGRMGQWDQSWSGSRVRWWWDWNTFYYRQDARSHFESKLRTPKNRNNPQTNCWGQWNSRIPWIKLIFWTLSNSLKNSQKSWLFSLRIRVFLKIEFSDIICDFITVYTKHFTGWCNTVTNSRCWLFSQDVYSPLFWSECVEA